MDGLKQSWQCIFQEHRVLGLVLLLGFVSGLGYLAAAPPWQHYDEPGHFEFAWLIANRPGFPEPGDFDQSMRRELAASMMEHDFFQENDSTPNLLSVHEPVWIGISQISDYPVYYTLLSLPLRLFRFSDITFQLYLARMVSLLLFLVTLTAAYGIACELSPPGHALRWMLPAGLALVPAVTDLMTGLNDDVGATAFFSLFIWAGIALIRRGFSLLRFIALLITVGLCFFTKITVNLVVVLAAIPLLFSLLRGRRRTAAWGALALMAVLAVPLVFSWGDAASWYRDTLQEAPSRASVEAAPFGKYTFQLVGAPGTTAKIFQTLPEPALKRLEGRAATLGAWMWASQRVTTTAPLFFDGQKAVSQTFEIGKEPQFYAIQVQVPDRFTRGQIILSFTNQDYNVPVTVYFDGIVLSPGRRPVDEPPRFTTARLDLGEWGERNFSNLARNASGEAGWPWIRPLAERAIQRYAIGAPSSILGALLDWQGGSWYYRSAIKNLFQTFWAVFGWGHVRLQPAWLYYVLGGVTLAGTGGALYGLVRRRFRLPWDIVLFLGVSVLWMWGAAFMRGLGSLVGEVFIPSARYAYPAAIPTLLVLCLGWLAFLSPQGRLARPDRMRYLPFWIFFLALNFYSLATLYLYYRL